jgi:hypothetical protein
MPKGRKKQPEMKVAGHFMKINGELVEINPFDPAHTDLQDRCKLAWAEMTTGQPHVLVERRKASGS